VAHVGEHPVQAHPLVPVLQVSADPAVVGRWGGDLDVVLPPDGTAAVRRGGAARLLACVVEVAARRYRPRLAARGNTDFQISRGAFGVSL